MKNHKHTVQAGFNPWSPFASPIHNALNHNCFLQMWFPSLFLLSNVEMMVLKKINHRALGTAPTQRYRIDFIRTTIRRFRYISIANISWCYRPTDMSFRLCLTCSHTLWALVCLALHMDSVFKPVQTPTKRPDTDHDCLFMTPAHLHMEVSCQARLHVQYVLTASSHIHTVVTVIVRKCSFVQVIAGVNSTHAANGFWGKQASDQSVLCLLL